jgi:hypothetical protein
VSSGHVVRRWAWVQEKEMVAQGALGGRGVSVWAVCTLLWEGSGGGGRVENVSTLHHL